MRVQERGGIPCCAVFKEEWKKRVVRKDDVLRQVLCGQLAAPWLAMGGGLVA